MFWKSYNCSSPILFYLKGSYLTVFFLISQFNRGSTLVFISSSKRFEPHLRLVMEASQVLQVYESRAAIDIMAFCKKSVSLGVCLHNLVPQFTVWYNFKIFSTMGDRNVHNSTFEFNKVIFSTGVRSNRKRKIYKTLIKQNNNNIRNHLILQELN